MGLFISFSIIISWIVSVSLALTARPVLFTHLTASDAALFFWIQFLFVGLFIISHDACHGALAPKHPRINLWLGRVSAFLYAGFLFDEIRKKHSHHHLYSGTELDPDYLKEGDGSGPYFFWIFSFFKKYVTVRQLLTMTAISQILMHVLKLPESNVLLFWVAPSIASAFQLFTFGTYLPHKVSRVGFADRHAARNSTQSFWPSLLLCYHFGACHLRHHQEPWLPWYQLYRPKTSK